MMGKASILKAIQLDDAVFGTLSRVPYINPLYSKYKLTSNEDFKLLADRRYLYQTYAVDAKMGFFVNFALRAYNKCLLNFVHRNKGFTAQFITVRLGEVLCTKLQELDDVRLKSKSAEDPIAYLRRNLRVKVFSKVDVSHYWFVAEQSDESVDHIHIIAAIPDGVAEDVRDLFKAPFWIGEPHGFERKSSSIAIASSYRQKLYLKRIGDEVAELLALEQELLDDPKWELVETKRSGTKVVTFVSVESLDIDVGIADYLAKETSRQHFQSSRYNYSVSQALRSDAKQVIDEQLRQNKVLKKELVRSK